MNIKKQKLAFILASLITINSLGSCSFKKEDNNNSSSAYLIENIETNTTKTFPEGTHILQYLVDCDYDYYENEYEGYVPTIEVPEGYIFVNVSTSIKSKLQSSGSGKVIFFLVNNVPVEVTGVIDSKTGLITYYNPGKPITNNLTLTPNK